MPKILIVEDDKNIANCLSTILLGAGFLCDAAPTADRARALLESDPDIGLVLLDQNLGENSRNGLVFLGELRETAKYRDLPVIVCSGETRAPVVMGFMSQKVAGFLRKPFRPDRLLADVQRVLGTGEASMVAAEAGAGAW